MLALVKQTREHLQRMLDDNTTPDQNLELAQRAIDSIDKDPRMVAAAFVMDPVERDPDL